MGLLKRYASWKLAGILFAIYCVFAFAIMPNLMRASENGGGPLDLLFSYSPQIAYEHIESYGDMRDQIAKLSLTIDTAYPIIYTSLFMVLVYLLAKFIWPAREKLHRLALIPIFAFIFDLCENASVVIMLKSYPEKLGGVARMASTFTSLKWTSVGVIFALLVGLMILALLKLRKNRA